MGTAMTTMFSARGNSGLLVSATHFSSRRPPLRGVQRARGDSQLIPSAALRGLLLPPGPPSLAREGDGHNEQTGRSHAEAEEVVRGRLARARAGPAAGLE